MSEARNWQMAAVIATKNVIDSAGRMPTVDLPLIFPRPNPTGSNAQNDFKMDVYVLPSW
jgi:hypothetical protein